MAGWFRFLGIPEVVVSWGHPLVMMGIMIFVVGTFVGGTYRVYLSEGT